MSENSDRPKPVPGPAADHVPAHVLDELRDMLADSAVPPSRYDLDDPSIDRLLGLGPEGAEGAEPVGPVAPAPDHLDGDPTMAMPPTLPATLPAILPATLLPTLPPSLPVDATTVDDPTGELPVVAPPRKTIVITDSGLPDSVYLDEEKEKGFHERREGERRDAVDGAPERATIKIEDFDEPAILDASTTKSPGAIDPRMRARRIAVRREEGRRRLVIVGVVAAVLVVVIVVIAAFASPLFDVTDVKVQGAVYTDDDVIAAVVADLEGRPVLLVDTKRAEATLEAVPWVEQAVVSTDFPHAVLIDIRERRPVATFQGSDGSFRVIDVEGRVLDVLAGQPATLALITGANPDSRRGEFAGAAYAAAGDLISSMPQEVRAVTTSVGVDTGTSTITITISDRLTVRLGDTTALADKLARLLAQLRGGLDGVCELDVSTPEIGQVECSAT